MAVMTPLMFACVHLCSLSPQQAHVGSTDVGLEKDDIDAGEPPEAEAAGDGRGPAWGSSKENSQPLAVPP